MSTEKETVLPLGELLSQETKRALIDWTIRRKRTQEKVKTKSGGRPRPKREQAQIYQPGLADRGQFIAQRITPLLPKDNSSEEDNFSKIFAHYLNGLLGDQDLSAQLNQVSQILKDLTQDQIDLAFQAYQIRRNFIQSPELTREKISQFNSDHVRAVPEAGFLPGLLATISHLYPDPKTVKK